MKFSLSTSFAKLALFALITIVLLTIGGRMVALDGNPSACPSWPLCIPDSYPAWAQLFHRITAALSAVTVLVLLFEAWRTQRDHRLLLPLTATFVVLFFSQVFVGMVQVTKGFPLYLMILHSITSVLVWISLVALVVISGFYAKDVVAFPPLNISQRLKDILTLTKPIIVLLLLVTTFAGMVAGGKAWPSLSLALWTMLGGAFAAGGSGAINQYIDRDLDKNMQRTAKRPMAAERMTPAEGLSFGLGLCIASFYIMAGYVNLLSAFLSLVGIIYYVLLYSVWLKKVTVHNIVIGGGAGAIPPLVGWAAATGRLDVPALILFLIVFMWTPPHFWALAIVRRKDYERAGVPMLPVIRGEAETRKQVWIYTLELVAVTFLLPILKYTGVVYLISAIIFGGILLYFAWRVFKSEGNKSAWTMYRYSSMYLMFLFLALMADALM
ncbi:MAG: heme o synthase [Chloroflexota bacterium]